MSASPSRRDVFRGLFGAGLAWLGFRAAAEAARAAPPPPNTNAPPPEVMRYSYSTDPTVLSVCTTVYDCRGRVIMQADPIRVTTYGYDLGGERPDARAT